MADAVTLEDAIAAVERAAKGIRTADARKQARDLFAAVDHLHRLREEARPITPDDVQAELGRLRMAAEARIAAARVGAALDRSRTP